MGIEISQFKALVKGAGGDNLAVTVKDEAKQKLGVAGVSGRRGLKTEELQPGVTIKADDLSRYQDNIYIRSQLLGAIRNALGGETGEFFQKAENRLLGGLVTNNKRSFGVRTGSADLTVGDIKNILQELDLELKKRSTGSVAPANNAPGRGAARLEGLVSTFIEMQGRPPLRPKIDGFQPIDAKTMREIALDADKHKALESKVGTFLADQALFIGQALLIADKLPELEKMCADPRRTSDDMEVLLHKVSGAKCHPKNISYNMTDTEEKNVPDAEYKNYVVRICRDYVDMLANGIETVVRNAGNDPDRQDEARVRFFKAHDGVCLEARMDNLQSVLSAPVTGTRPLCHEMTQIFEKMCDDRMLNDIRRSLSSHEYNAKDLAGENPDEEQINAKYNNMTALEILAVLKPHRKLTKEEKKDFGKVSPFRDYCNGAWSMIEEKFKNYLMENYVGQSSPAFRLSKTGKGWKVDLLQRNGKPVMRRLSDADVDRMAGLFCEFCGDGPYVNTEVEENKIEVKDERVNDIGHTYFDEMQKLAAKCDSNKKFFDSLVKSVGRKLKSNGMGSIAQGELTRKVKDELAALGNLKDENDYLKTFGPLVDGQFGELLTNWERLLKLVEGRIFAAANIEEQQVKGKTVRLPNMALMLRNLKPSAMKVARAMKMKFPERLPKSVFEIANRICNACASFYEDKKWGYLAQLVTPYGRLKHEPKLEYAVTTYEQNMLDDFHDYYLQDTGGRFRGMYAASFRQFPPVDD